MISEARVLHEILLDLGAEPWLRIFRNNVGLAKDGFGHHLKFGLAKGASDLLAIVKPNGRWLALEVKSESGRLRPEQRNFLDMVNNMGGIGRCVRSKEEARAAAEEARK